MLCTTPIGARVCISLLDRMVTLFDAPETSDGGKAFDIGYASTALLMVLFVTLIIARTVTICSLAYSITGWLQTCIPNSPCELIFNSYSAGNHESR